MCAPSSNSTPPPGQPTEPAMIRLFVAIDLPKTVANLLQGLAHGIPGARWVDPTQTHLTLRFIGEVGDLRFDDIRMELGRIRAQAFRLELTGVDVFASRRRARTLWAGVSVGPELAALQAKVEAAVVRAGVTPERRKSSPHVTLARLNGAPVGRLHEFLSRYGLFRAPAFAVNSFVLYSSHLSRSGALHQAEVEYALDRRGCV
jgi:2'-5' RNA ligase